MSIINLKNLTQLDKNRWEILELILHQWTKESYNNDLIAFISSVIIQYAQDEDVGFLPNDAYKNIIISNNNHTANCENHYRTVIYGNSLDVGLYKYKVTIKGSYVGIAFVCCDYIDFDEECGHKDGCCVIYHTGVYYVDSNYGSCLGNFFFGNDSEILVEILLLEDKQFGSATITNRKTNKKFDFDKIEKPIKLAFVLHCSAVTVYRE